MATQVALLRAVNVGGRGRVAMADLRELLESLGFDHVQSVLQSGNLVFHTDCEGGAQLERLLEAEAAQRLELGTDFLLRTAGEWSQVIERNPFPEVAKEDPGHLVVMFLKQVPNLASVDLLRVAMKGPEDVRADGNRLYISYPDGIGRSRLTGGLIEARLRTRGTGRNWSTVLKIADLIRS